jgi:S1-C subfamily serine protease
MAPPELCINESCPLTIMTSSGSGSVIDHVNGKTYILTAGHVCEQPEGSASIAAAVGGDGTVHEVETSKYSKDPDLCVMRSKGTWGKALKISSKNPEYGDEVSAMSAPNGIFSENMVPLFKGIYSGDLSDGDGVYTIPAMAGTSGAAILNDDLDIVAVVHSATKGFQHVAIGSNASKIDQFMKGIEDFMRGE